MKVGTAIRHLPLSCALSLREHRNLQNAMFCEEGVDQNLVMEIKFMLDSFSRCLGMSHVGLSSITKILSKMTTDLKTNYDAEMCTLLRC